MKATCLAVVILALAMACSADRSATNAQQSKTHVPNSTRMAAVAIDPRLIAIKERLRLTPRDTAARHELASRYRELGYRGMASFYDTTATYIVTGTVDYQAPSPIQWQCPSTDNADTLAMARRLHSEIAPSYNTVAEAKAAAPHHHADLASAVSHASILLRNHGASCDLLLVWADGVRLLAEEAPSDVPPDQSEAAVRLLYTFCEEAHDYPLGTVDDVTALTGISHYFAGAENDYISAYVVATIALQRAAKSDDPVRESERLYLLRYLSKLRARAEGQRSSLQ